MTFLGVFAHAFLVGCLIRVGFLVRQENLAFCNNDRTSYNVDRYRTKHFKEGVFNKSVAHKSHSFVFTFSPSSFSTFKVLLTVGGTSLLIGIRKRTLCICVSYIW